MSDHFAHETDLSQEDGKLAGGFRVGGLLFDDKRLSVMGNFAIASMSFRQKIPTAREHHPATGVLSANLAQL
ncbi:MAG: hypothetical protein U0361_21415 [Nitrospiraceae bacterium]